MTLDMLYDRRTLKQVDNPTSDGWTWYEAPNGDFIQESKSRQTFSIVPAKLRAEIKKETQSTPDRSVGVQ